LGLGCIQEAIIDKTVSVIIRDVDIPTPKPGQVLIRVVVSGLVPDTTTRMRTWPGLGVGMSTSRMMTETVLSIIKWQPDTVLNQGDDIAGYVEAVGEGVRNFRKGDKVPSPTASTYPAMSSPWFRTVSGCHLGTFQSFGLVPGPK
jgi:NADPH2:quinone reductase